MKKNILILFCIFLYFVLGAELCGHFSSDDKEVITTTAKEICEINLPEFDILSKYYGDDIRIYRIKVKNNIKGSTDTYDPGIYTYTLPERNRNLYFRLKSKFVTPETTWQQPYEYKISKIDNYSLTSCEIMFSEKSDTAVVEIITP